MLDISTTVISKSDQLNAIDLVGGPVTLKVTDVKVVAGDQPVHIHYEGCGERVFKPCLSMRRVLIMAWTKDASTYIGKSMTVYNDESVKWAAAEVGGCRISHLSHIEKPLRMMLTITRGQKAPYVVQPLQLTAGPSLSADDAKLWKSEIDRCTNMAGLSDVTAKIASNKYADSDIKADLMKHYRSAVTAIREDDAAPDNPANMDFPADTDTDKEG